MQRIVPSFEVRGSVPRVLALALVLLCGAGCQDSSGIALDDLLTVSRDSAAAFQTDSLKYTLNTEPYGYELDIGFTFTNPTASTVYVMNCRALWQFHVEKYENGTWVRAYFPILPGCFSEPIVVPAASESRASVRIVAGYPETNIYPKFDVSSIPGVYRIVWNHIVDSWNEQRQTWGAETPAAHRVSNRFVLVAAPR